MTISEAVDKLSKLGACETKMRLLIINNDMGFHGAATSSRLLCDGLCKRGHRVDIWSITSKGLEFPSKADVILLYNLLPQYKLAASKFYYEREVPIFDLSCGDPQYPPWEEQGLSSQIPSYVSRLRGYIIKNPTELDMALAFVKELSIIRLISHGVAVSKSVKCRHLPSRPETFLYGYAGRADLSQAWLSNTCSQYNKCLISAIALPAHVMKAFYGIINALVIPRVHLIGSNAAFEAMSYKIPILITEGLGNNSQIEDGVQGFFFKDIPSLLDKMADLEALPREKYEAMGQAGYDHVAKHYSLSQMIDNFENLFLTAIEEFHE